jgi:hypothetical protein
MPLQHTHPAPAPAPAAAPPPQAPEWRWEESDDAVRAYGIFLGVLAAGNLPMLQENQLFDLPYFIALAVRTRCRPAGCMHAQCRPAAALACRRCTS